MKGLETVFNPSRIAEEIKQIELEKMENLSPESLRFRNMERNLKISDFDGISDFNQTPNGEFITYTTNNKSELKVFDRKTGTVKILYTATKEKGDEIINLEDNLKTYRLENNFAVGYTRKGEFVMQELSHSNQQGEIILTMEQSHLGMNCLLSKNRKNLITQNSADEINFNNIKTGEEKKIDLDFYSSKMIDNENGSFGMVTGTSELVIFDKDNEKVFNKLKTKEPFMTASFIDDDSHFVLSQNEKLVFYEIQNNNYKQEKEINIGFRTDQIIEATDKKHLFCHSYNLGGFFVVEKETGKVISKIDSEKIQQDWKGEIVVLNRDGAIEKWNLKETPTTKDKTQKIFIVDENPKYNEDEYSMFYVKEGETIKGVFWHEHYNAGSLQLQRERKFEWGKQRLYLEVPLNDMEKVKDIVEEISSKESIPIQFKFIDQNKTDLEIVKDKTRFVLNFRNIMDAKKFYHSLSQNEIYANIIPDREQDYFGYKLDDKTFYASGFAEYRKDDLENITEYLKNTYTENPDGTYKSKNPNVETGEFDVLTSEEYQNILRGQNPSDISKNNWETVSN